MIAAQGMNTVTVQEQNTVLVVDDEKVNLDLISVLLRNRGFRALVPPAHRKL